MTVKTMRLDNFLERPDTDHYWCNGCKLWHHYRVECPTRDASPAPLPDSYPDAPTLSPEAQAVLDAAVNWAAERKRLAKHRRSDYPVCQILEEEVNDYLHTLSPKDYAPDELEPGQRFRWAAASGRDDQMDNINIVRLVANCSLHYTCENDGDLNVYSFTGIDRLIPLPEQDG